jgi:hypothetical protein
MTGLVSTVLIFFSASVFVAHALDAYRTLSRAESHFGRGGGSRLVVVAGFGLAGSQL